MVRERATPNDTKPLTGLLGLNLWTGSGGETQDIEYKHVMKHKFAVPSHLMYYTDRKLRERCKPLYTRKGILVNNVNINKSLLAWWFKSLSGVNWSKNTDILPPY